MERPTDLPRSFLTVMSPFFHVIGEGVSACMNKILNVLPRKELEEEIGHLD